MFARFLKKPLAWALLAVLGPAWTLNMGRLMSEKPALAFLLASLYALVRGCEEAEAKKDAWLLGSGMLMGLALLSKYAAGAAVPAALWYLRDRKTGAGRAAWWAATACGPAALYLAARPELVSGAAATMAGASEGAWGAPVHRARSIAAFLGGLAVLPALGRFPRRTLGAALAGAALLFVPWLDAASVRPLDRATGAWLAAGGLAALWTAAAARKAAGRALWLPWLAGAALFAAAYWTVTSRVVLFAVPPLVLALGAAFESGGEKRSPAPAAAALAAALSLALGWVDFVYAGAQKDLAAELAATGRPVRVAARLGLRHYLLRAGARPLDGEDDWKALRPGELAAFARTTTNFHPATPRRVNTRAIRVGSAVPLRLISGFGGEAGFYSNVSGFLPFSVSSEPVEEFTVVEAL
ncbi:MAG: glycosyltransferase family 39 protein [Elusimicrobiota bacterium]|nr:MAG: glycosyltransferase family 39 protein [Elusimicrobiota bacterium]